MAWKTGKFQLVAGHVALDFANTMDNRYDPERRVDLLGSYRDLLAFCEEAGALTSSESRRLARCVEDAGPSVLASARELREVIERVFSSRARGQWCDSTDLRILNGFVKAALCHRELFSEHGALNWKWAGIDQEPRGPLWPIALAAAELLVSREVIYVRECHSEMCRWLFLDLSKNHSRRWCDMKLCGNRSKAKRYYERRS